MGGFLVGKRLFSRYTGGTSYLVLYYSMPHPTQKILVLLDGNALIHRAYHALPPLTTKGGETVQAVYGFAMTMLSVMEKFHPEYIAASFDLAGPTFRHERYAEYKGTRAKAPDDLYAQIPRVKELVRAFNIPIYELAGYEADDCVGTLARQATLADPELGVIIVTGDNDALQLVNDRVKVYALRKGIKDTLLYDEAGVVAKYGFKPDQLRDYKGLRGDTSDNIPGVKGIGEKGATDLLQKYGTLEGVYEHIDEITGALGQKLITGKENAFLSKELGTIDTAAPITLALEDCRTREYDRETVVALFHELSFQSLLKRLPGGAEGSTNPSTSTEAEVGRAGQAKGRKLTPKVVVLKTKEEAEKFLASCRGAGAVAVSLDVQAGTLFGSGLQGVNVALEKGKIVSIAYHTETKASLKNFFEDGTMAKITYDAKRTMHVLAGEGIGLVGVAWDVLLSGYLLQAGSAISLENLALEEGIDVDFGRGVLPYVPTVTDTIWQLKKSHEERLKKISEEQKSEQNLLKLLIDLEMPLLSILFQMEQSGVKLNGQILKKLSDEMTTDLGKIEKRICDFAGREFNINSPKQLAQVLFEDLHIPTKGIKKTKTGISTASPELAKLKGEYPIAALIEDYREQSKLKNTYLDVLPRLVGSDGRLHTTYQQAVAATGRLSSADPNLQNIPARGAWSERIRSAFEAGAGCVLVGADYSQIELRVAAHLANDTEMLAAYARGEDIHRVTASAVYGVPVAEVTDDMRRQAKVFNFGILYGMGAYGLSVAADIDQETAAKFIAEYFQKFAGIARYMEQMKRSAREHGYVETELGRRRYLPEIASTNVQIVRSAERMAINMPVQGLEADIVKLAMLAVEQMIAENYTETSSQAATMLLQVHDELIFEVKEERAEAFMADVKRVMESVYPLRASLIVEVYQGKNWGEI